MAKLAVLAVLASLLGTVSCKFSIYLSYGFPPPNSSLPYPRIAPPCPPPTPTPGLKVGYYAAHNCSRAEEIVRDAVWNATAGEKAGLVRLFFHDCFVEGCDASVLLNQVPGGSKTERQAFPNLSLRGFEVIEAAKVALEKECPGVVSCADIVAFAGRDASYNLSYGAINYQVAAGRYDGKISVQNNIFGNLPPPFANLTELTRIFAAKGLNQTEMVILSGAHSIGRSSCTSFSGRVPPPASPTNTSMSTKLAGIVMKNCSVGTDDSTVRQDFVTPNKLDGQYYKNVLGHNVLFDSDAALASKETRGLVNFYAGNGFLPGYGFYFGEKKWYQHFGEAMVKMGYIGVKTSAKGEIRKTCGKVN